MSKSIFSIKNLLCIIAILLAIAVCLTECNRLKTECNRQKYSLEKTNQGLWLILIGNDYISEKIRKNKQWEADITNYIVKNVKPSETVVEIGANIGYYTTLLAKLIGEKGRVYSYEANDEVYEIAQLAVNINNFSRIVKLKNIAITDKKSTVNFAYKKPNVLSISTINIGTSHIATQRNEEKFHKNETLTIKLLKILFKQRECDFLQKKVLTTTLDEDLNGIKNVDWLRMDIEGSEILALKGAKKLIKNSPNLKIITEWSPRLLRKYGDVQELVKEIRNYGFKFYLIQTQGTLSPELSDTTLTTTNDIDVLISRP